MTAVLPLPHPLADPAPRDPRQRLQREQLRLGKRLQRQVGQAIADFGMISPGDKIMVCLSGGKDSYTMLDMLLQLQRKAPVPFTLVAVNLDQKQPDFPAHVLPAYLDALGVPFDIVEQDTYSVVSRVVPAGKTMCSLCSRLRRGALYAYAQTHGVTKIALGHHRDDIVATFFMNLFHHARLAAMAPKLRSDDGAHVVIRPLAYVREAHIAAYAQARQFPIIPCNPVRQPGKTCSASRSARCCNTGTTSSPGASSRLPAPWAMSAPNNWPTARCSISWRWAAAAMRRPILRLIPARG